MDVPRHEVVAFALYTVHGGVMKMTAQLYLLKDSEPREARLEVQREAGEKSAIGQRTITF